jgi:D-alanyl-D-alanine carboxypeptidase (penicillin-binding protein 5/6)
LVLLQNGKEMGAVDVLAARGVKPEEQGFLAKLAAWFRSLWKGFF